MDNPFLKNKSVVDIDELALEAIDLAYINGVIMKKKDRADSVDLITHMPITLFPSPFSRVHFLQACNIQQSFNLLMHRASHDYNFLKEALSSVIQADDFTRNLWEIYEKIHVEGVSQPLCLSLNRSDYMVDCSVSAEDIIKDKTLLNPSLFKLRQVEFNTISVGASGIIERLSLLHRYIVTCQYPELNISTQHLNNKAVDGVVEALHFAWKLYDRQKSVILFLVYKTERFMLFDQRCIEFRLKQRDPCVRVIRRTLNDISERGQLTEDKRLVIDGMEVAIIYQRFGYKPEDFEGEKDWNTRLMIERSMAIKCPSIAYHLVGTKKVQQVLATSGVVEKFIDDSEVQRQIRDTFTGLYSLDLNSVEGDKAVKLALEVPTCFVLKPQREGGGNITYGEAIRSVLTPIQNSVERKGYILMERIHPVPFENIILKPGNKPQRHYMVSELGIYGALVGTKENVMLNSQIGHLLRSKVVGVDEGDVMADFAALDTPFLV